MLLCTLGQLRLSSPQPPRPPSPPRNLGEFRAFTVQGPLSFELSAGLVDCFQSADWDLDKGAAWILSVGCCGGGEGQAAGVHTGECVDC